MHFTESYDGSSVLGFYCISVMQDFMFQQWKNTFVKKLRMLNHQKIVLRIKASSHGTGILLFVFFRKIFYATYVFHTRGLELFSVFGKRIFLNLMSWYYSVVRWISKHAIKAQTIVLDEDGIAKHVTAVRYHFDRHRLKYHTPRATKEGLGQIRNGVFI